MSSVIGSLSNTLVAVLNTVNVVANQATHTVNTAASGLDMLDNYVRVAHTKQAAAIEFDLKTFRANLRRSEATKQVALELEHERKCQLDPAFSEAYEKVFADFQDVEDRINARLAPKTA